MTGLDLVAIGLQIMLPLALLAWLAFSPMANRFSLLVQAAAVGAILIGLMLVGVWLVPPWWTPWLFLVMWPALTLWRTTRNWRKMPGRWRSFDVVGTAMLLALAAWSGSLIVPALAGRHPPDDRRVVDLGTPLPAGTYLVASGGAAAAINGHFLTLHPKTARQRAYRGQSYAVDLIKLGRFGLRASGWRPADPAAYAIFGQPVLAPCTGTVLVASDARPDMPVPVTDQTRLEGNHVFVGCGDFGVSLAHMKRGSVLVRAGDQVSQGQKIGLVGNSGQSSEPHLHLHAQRLAREGQPLLSGDPLYFTIRGQFLVRNDRLVIDR